MRQLLQRGWMHNRLRMVTASFLTKDLHVWWPHGARHFLDHLRDGDLASNNHGWQWVAGTGTDAAPYFLIADSGVLSHRSTKAGDNWAAGQVPTTAPVGVGLGLPTLRTTNKNLLNTETAAAATGRPHPGIEALHPVAHAAGV